MKRRTTFEFPSLHKETSWRLVMSKEGNDVFFDLHWKDKDRPTHSFSVREDQLLEAIEVLKGE